MHHRSTSASSEIELFPFLSILFCTIGTLILIIILLVAQANGSEKKVTIIAKNNNSISKTKIPRYIECQSDGVIIHPSQEFISIDEFELLNSPLNTLFSEIKARGTEYLIVAVRPDGVEVFQEVRELIESEEIELGYEPIDQDWKLEVKQQK